MYRCTGAQVNRCTGAQMYRCIGVQVNRCTGVQVYRCTGVQVHRCTGVQVYRCTGAQVHRCTGVQVYRCTGAWADVLDDQKNCVLRNRYNSTCKLACQFNPNCNRVDVWSLKPCT